MTRVLVHSHRVFTPRSVVDRKASEGLPDGVCGRVIGQACSYNTVDDYGTFFKPGCFDRSRAEKIPAGKVGLFRDHQHFSGQHVGIVRDLSDVGNAVMMSADILDTPEGQDTKKYLDTVLRAKGSTGLSVGVYPRKSGTYAAPSDPLGVEQAQGFDEVELAEISITPFPAVPGSHVLAVRRAAAMLTFAGKTKRVAGEDLSAEDFIIVGDADDPSTWKLPWHFSSDEKTKSHLRNALARFDQMTGVSAEVKAKAKAKLHRLCKKYGIDVSDDDGERAADDGDESGNNDANGEPDKQRAAKPGESNADDPDDGNDRPSGEPAPNRDHAGQIVVLRMLLTSMPRDLIEAVVREYGLVGIGSTHTSLEALGAPQRSHSTRVVDPAHRLAFLREHFEEYTK